MELGEIHSRVCKLEEILTHLAKWTNFDLQKFNNSTSTTPSVDLLSSHPPTLPTVDHVDNEQLQSGQGHEVGIDLDLDLGPDEEVDVVYKIEVDVETSEDEDIDKKETAGEVELKVLMEGDDDLELNDPHCSPTPTKEKDDGGNSSTSGSGSRPDESDKELSSNLKLRELRRLKITRRGISRVHRATEKGRITVFPKTSPFLPYPFVSMDRLTSGQLLNYNNQVPPRVKVKLPPQPQHVHEHLRSKHQHDLRKHPKLTVLQRHLKPTHNQEYQDRKYSHCYFCPAKFKRHKDLNRHLNIHTGEKPYKCSKCQYSAGDIIALRYHERNTSRNHHTTELKNSHGPPASDPDSGFINCYFCNAKLKSPKSNRNLQQHLRLHTGEMPYKCPRSRCKYSTVSSGNLSHHFRRCQNVSQKVQDTDVDKWRIQQTRIRNVWQRKNETRERSGPQDDDVREYKCLICKDTYDVVSDFTRHVKSVHFSKEVQNVRRHSAIIKPSGVI